jgi:penicillin-binding protein 2
MLTSIQRFFHKIGRRKYNDIAPDEVFLDSRNLPAFNTHQFEGRLEKPVSTMSFRFVIAVFVIVVIVFSSKLWILQVAQGSYYRERSENNSLKESVIVAPRGIIYSRDGARLAWNHATSNPELFPERKYIESPGFGTLLGFIKYPSLDSSGFYIEEDFVPKDGVELHMNEILSGTNGHKLTEVSVDNIPVSESVIDKPKEGADLVLSVDSRIQREMYKGIYELREKVGFEGGAGVIMDIESGEILSLVSFPEYDPKVMTEGKDKDKINDYLSNPQNPFLGRVISGLYTPGSIIKPFLAFAALEEGVITPEKEIVSTGRLVVPNPYNKDNPTIFKDWKAHGATDMRRAIAVSSDVYFYQIGGGFGSQKGLGIENIKKYLERFGLAHKTGFSFGDEAEGVIPSPEWKKKTFDEDWRIGDTYNTSIGQYGMQVTPIQVVRAVAVLANGGYLVEPSLIFTATNTPIFSDIKIEGSEENFQVVRDGMRLAVKEGTAIGLNTKAVEIAGKTGTAELGARKQFVNSWVVGFFPYEEPKYAFTLVMERGPVQNLVGATSVMRRVIDFMAEYTPEYFE